MRKTLQAFFLSPVALLTLLAHCIVHTRTKNFTAIAFVSWAAQETTTILVRNWTSSIEIGLANPSNYMVRWKSSMDEWFYRLIQIAWLSWFFLQIQRGWQLSSSTVLVFVSMHVQCFQGRQTSGNVPLREPRAGESRTMNVAQDLGNRWSSPSLNRKAFMSKRIKEWIIWHLIVI